MFLLIFSVALTCTLSVSLILTSPRLIVCLFDFARFFFFFAWFFFCALGSAYFPFTTVMNTGIVIFSSIPYTLHR